MNKTAVIPKGTDLLTALVASGVYIKSNCGGEGVCGRCKVIVNSGKYESQETSRLSKEEISQGYALACLTVINGDIEVTVPEESILDMGTVKDVNDKTISLVRLDPESNDAPEGAALINEDVLTITPLVKKIYMELAPPNMDDKISDLDRLIRTVSEKIGKGHIEADMSIISSLGAVLRNSKWNITVSVADTGNVFRIISIESGNKESNNFGIALDIGTTTVTAQLVNLSDLSILGTKAMYNKQIVFGDDIITRIIFASGESGLERLHKAVTENINALINELAAAAGISREDITCVTCAGNTTMIHLLLRIDPAYLRKEPYVPTANSVPVFPAVNAGIRINPSGVLYCVPGVASYVGGDITAGVLSCGMGGEDKLTLLIDIGTNGEIVFGNKEWLVTSAASAGPAFEGTGVSCGMRASTGAIQNFSVDGDLNVEIKTINDEKPRGICGSGYIEIISEMFIRGIISRDGKINTDLKNDRVRMRDDEAEFVVAFKEETEGGFDIVVRESDIENIKRSKGAIYSAISVLLKKVGVKIEDVKNIYVAGGFGTYLDVNKAVLIGLLPDLPRHYFKYIGNSSLAGSREALISSMARNALKILAKKMTYIELSNDAEYNDEYVKSLFFPHTDLESFPTVKKA